eukprot:10184402-Alexandrium_andersonii.AAC.1
MERLAADELERLAACTLPLHSVSRLLAELLPDGPRHAAAAATACRGRAGVPNATDASAGN